MCKDFFLWKKGVYFLYCVDAVVIITEHLFPYFMYKGCPGSKVLVHKDAVTLHLLT